MNFFRKIPAFCALVLALSMALSGCGGGVRQEAADSAEEAALHFLTNLQNGEFDMAKTYLDAANPLRYVLPAGEGEDAPELAAVYQQFCEKLRDITFRVGDEGTVGISMVYITASQYDFRSAINNAMLEAIQTQCQGGGDAFADYAGWMSRGIANAAMGEESTARATATKNSGTYTIDYRGYSDHDFLNLITGGFYDYADFQMAVCTNTVDGVDHVYYFAALGDEVIACIESISEVDDTGEMDDAALEELNEFYMQYAEQTPGLYMGAYKEGSRVTISVGIDFQTADQNALVNAGIVSGEYQGNMVDGWLSLSATASSFEQDGMSCVITPVYE